eukprot:scaffold24970_cov34-Attheya_sp.AAC.2
MNLAPGPSNKMSPNSENNYLLLRRALLRICWSVSSQTSGVVFSGVIFSILHHAVMIVYATTQDTYALGALKILSAIQFVVGILKALSAPALIQVDYNYCLDIISMTWLLLRKLPNDEFATGLFMTSRFFSRSTCVSCRKKSTGGLLVRLSSASGGCSFGRIAMLCSPTGTILTMETAGVLKLRVQQKL